ncbi:MAG: PAS domain S-box protein [Candidatus Bathyarchaeota archaeon]|nr:PAS domain S-box protein [Candidatus Bathyarchaeota archaeon]
MVMAGETINQKINTELITNKLHSKIKVLHLDDDETSLQISKEIIEQFDPTLEIINVGNVTEALNKLNEEEVDLIISDYDMPDTNGIKFAAIIKSKYNIPFILYTGRGSETIAEMAYAAKIDDYLHKENEPAHFQVLANRIRSAVEKKRSEIALIQSEKRLRLILDSSPEGVTVNILGKLVYANKHFADMIGNTVEELLNTSIIELHRDNYKEIVSERTRRRSLGEKVPNCYEVELIKKDGSTLPVEYYISPIIFNGEKASLTFIRDISQIKEKVELEKKIVSLHQHAHKINELRSTKEVAKVTLDILQSHLNCNFLSIQAVIGDYLHILTTKGTEPIGIPMSIQGKGLTSKVARERKTAMINDTRIDPTYLKGSTETLSELAAPILCKGELLGVLNAESLELNAFSDNERVLMEALADMVGSTMMRIRRDEQALETARFYELVYENIEDGVYVTNNQDSIIYVNKGMQKIAGVESNKILNINILEGFDEATLASFRPLYLLAKETLTRTKYEFVPVVTPAGRFSIQSGEIIPLKKGEVFDGAIVVVKDTTERKMYIDKLESNNRKLSAIHKQAIELSRSRDVEDIGVCIVNTLVNTLGVTECSFAIVEGDNLLHIVTHFDGRSEVYHDRKNSFTQKVSGKGIVSRAVRKGITQVVNDIRYDPDFSLDSNKESDNTLSEMVVPIIVGEKVVAAINIENDYAGAFSIADVQLVEILAMHVSAHFDKKAFELTCPTSKYLTQQTQNK